MTTVADASRSPRAAARPAAPEGDHRLLELVHHRRPQEDRHPLRHTALVFFVVGGVEALLHPAAARAARTARVLTAAQYNQLFTMHGTTMVFLRGHADGGRVRQLPRAAEIGARDVAFPRLNMFGYWVFLVRRPVHLLELLPRRRARTAAGSATRRSPARRSSGGFLPGHGPDFWAVGLIMLGIGSTTSAINFIVTILNMRAPGMTLMRMPVFTWMMLVVAFLTAVRDADHHRRADHGVLRPQLRHELLQRRRPAAIRCSTSTCSGSSAIPRCTS